jgi:hypothetical protein
MEVGHFTTVGDTFFSEPTGADDNFGSRFGDSTWSAFVKFSTGYILIVFIAIGVLGNVVSLVIFIMESSWERAACTYLSYLATTDIGCLYFQLQHWMFQGVFLLTNGERSYFWRTMDFACKINNFAYFSYLFLSSWLIIAYSVERCVAVTAPLEMNQLFTPGRRKVGLAVLVVVVVPLFIFDATHSELVNIPGPGNRLQCRMVKEKHPAWESFFFTMKNVIIIYVLPVMLILFINSVILFQILRSQNEAVTSGMTSKNRTKSKSRDMKATISLLGISAMYLITMSPSAVFMLMFAYSEMTNFAHANILVLQELAFFGLNFSSINYSCNFLVYTVSLDFYRARLVSMFCWKGMQSRGKRTGCFPKTIAQ